jgi:hypothetical protein
MKEGISGYHIDEVAGATDFSSAYEFVFLNVSLTWLACQFLNNRFDVGLSSQSLFLESSSYMISSKAINEGLLRIAF